MKKNHILAVGSVALDTVKTPFGKVTDALGGSATYFSASARFFSDLSIVAVVGTDFPSKHMDLLKSLGIDTTGFQVEKGKTFRWSGYYDFDLNTAKTLKTELNVFESFRPKISALHKRAGNVFLANIDPDLQLSVINQVQKPQFSACDTMNYWIQTKSKSIVKVLSKVDAFLCNDAEIRQLTGEYSLVKAAKWVFDKGPKILVVKKGEHGVLCFSKNFVFSVPAYLLERVFDPTGAGDSFAGGFVGYLAKTSKINEASLKKAVIYGSVLASYNVESFSLDRLSRLGAKDIRIRYKAFRKMTQF